VQRELVLKAQHGDAEAFGALARGAIDRLHGVAYRILRDSDQADDATQQALVSAWDHLPDLRDPDRFDAWTYRLVVRAAYKEARRIRSQHDRVRWLPSGGDAGERMPDRVADQDELEQAFKALTPEHRAVLTLRYYCDLPLASIADALDVPVGTVASRIHRASRHLRDALQRERQHEPAAEQALS
jgi:RNA polymerase sigma-70 factor (ECF subfamily)